MRRSPQPEPAGATASSLGGLASLPRLAIRRPGVAAAVALLVLVAALPGLFRLELATDVRALAPPSAAAVRADRAVRATHGVGSPLAVVVRSAGSAGIYAPPVLELVGRLTEELRALSGVTEAGLVSLATEPGLRSGGSFVDRSTSWPSLLEPMPDEPEELGRLRHELSSPVLAPLYDGILVADDGRATALFVDTPAGADRHRFYLAVLRAVAGARAGAEPSALREVEIEVVGAPAAEALLGLHILHDLGLPASWLGRPPTPSRTLPLVPLALGLMALVFLVAFRRPAAALLPLAEAGLALVVVFGAMGWLGVPIYLTTTVLPVVLTAVGVADEIHIFRRFTDRVREARETGEKLVRTTLAEETLGEMVRPVTRTSATTAAGFLSFALSPLQPVASFGLAAAAGVGVCLLISLTLVPALLAHTPLSWWLGRRPGPADNGRAWRRFAGWTARSRGAVITGFAALALAAGAAALALTVQDSWEDGFAPESDFARAAHRFDRDFLGAHQLLVAVTSPARLVEGEVERAAVGDRELLLPAGAAEEIAPERLVGAELRVTARADDGSPQNEARVWRGWIDAAARRDDRLAVGWRPQQGSPRFWLLGPASRAAGIERLGFELDQRPFLVPERMAAVAEIEAMLAEHPAVGGALGPASYLVTVARMTGGPSRGLPDQPAGLQSLWGLYGRVRGTARLERIVTPERFNQVLVTAYLEGANYADTRALLADLERFERHRLRPAGLALHLAGDVAVSQALIGAVVTTQVRSLLLSLGVIFLLTSLYGRSWRAGALCLLPPMLAVVVDFGLLGALGIPLGVATSMFAGMVLGVGVDGPIHLLEAFRRTPGERRHRLERAVAQVGPAVAVDAAALGIGFAVLFASEVPATARLGGLLVASVVTCLAGTLLLLPALLGRGR